MKNTDTPIRILVADDFDPWRAQTRCILHERPEWQIVSEACDGLEAVRKAAELHPEVVLLDIRMPLLGGIEAAQNILRDSPEAKVVFVTQNGDAEIRRAALDTGAQGYVLKANAQRELIHAISAALGDYVPSARLLSDL